MNNRDIERILNQIESLLELHGENSFKSRAYGRAARAIRSAQVDIQQLRSDGNPIDAIDGVGKGLAAEIEEMLDTGNSSQLEDLLERTPNGLLDVMSIRGLGAKKVRTLWDELGVESLDDLERRASAGEVSALKGFGKKTEENILQGIADLKATMGRMRLNTAVRLSELLREEIAAIEEVKQIAIAGRLRRGATDVGQLEFVVATANSIATVEAISAIEGISEIQTKEQSDRLILKGTYQESYTLFFYLVQPEDFVLQLHQKSAASDYRFMISIPLHDNGYELSEDELLHNGSRVTLENEQELYRLAGMQFIPPELREGIDEVRVALEGRLPELVNESEFRGMIHVHSTWSDGQNSIEEMAEEAKSRGYSYLLMTDHSKAAFYANGLDEKRLDEQGKEIDALNNRFDPSDFRILKGIECDILADGSLDLSDDALAALDCVIISVHSSFNLPLEAQTDRVCRALEHPLSTMLAHPTGRLILSRKGYAVDLQRVISTAAENGKYLELNANPYRLDLDWRMVRYAKRKGVPIGINPDAHSLADFDNVKYGVMMGRKGWLSAEDVINTWSCDQFLERLGRMRTA